MPTGELLGPPISGAIYGATNNWHCVIAFSGTIQVAAAIVLLYGASASLRFTRLHLTMHGDPFSKVQERAFSVQDLLERGSRS